MKKVLLLQVIFFLAIFSSCSNIGKERIKNASSLAMDTTKKDLKIIYSTPSFLIKIIDTQLVYTQYIDVFDNPIAAIPSSRIAKDSLVRLKNNDIIQLIDLVDKSGFWNLNNLYGEAETERAYIYSIEIELDSNIKKVSYRNGQHAQSAPEAFILLERKLIELKGN